LASGAQKTGARHFGKAFRVRNPAVEFDEILARKWQELDKIT
jgi:hypothetical protein